MFVIVKVIVYFYARVGFRAALVGFGAATIRNYVAVCSRRLLLCSRWLFVLIVICLYERRFFQLTIQIY